MSSCLKRLFLAVVIVFLTATFALAGLIHTEGGPINDAADGTPANGSYFRVFRVGDYSKIVTGIVGALVSNAWIEEVGAKLPETPERPNGWLVGDDHMCIIDKEINSGTSSHKGYYAVINKNLTGYDPDEFNLCVLRPIPIPVAVGGNNSVTLSWSAAQEDPGTPVMTNITGYRILRSTSPTGPYTFLATVEGSTNYVDNTAVNGTTYYYVIQLVYRTTSVPPLLSMYYSANSNSVTPSASSTPTIISVNPISAYRGDTLNVVVTGSNTNFVNGITTVNLGSGITVNSVSVSSPTSLTANITIATAASTGLRNITVTTGAETANGSNVFTVNSPSISISPATADQGWSGNIVVSGIGTHFINGSTNASISGSGITINSVTITNSTSATINISISSSAAIGARTLTLSTNLGAAGTENISTNLTINASGSTSGLVIDDYEYYANRDSRGMMDYYYQSGGNADEVVISSPVNSTAQVKEGLRSLQVTYPGASGAKWGGYVGGGLNSDTKDLTPYDGISLWVKGDGSSNTIAISLKEADESGVEQETYISGDISLSDTNWHEIEIPFSGFARDPYGVQREGVFSKVIKGYTIIYRGSQVNSLAHYIDYIVAKDVSVSGLPTVTGVTPNSGSNATATDVVISGTNFGGTTSVKIGTWDVSSFSVVSASSINARIPSGLPVGTYHITVTNGYGTSATSAADQFTVTSGGSGSTSGLVIDDYEYYANRDSRGMMDYYYQSGGNADEVVISSPVNSTAQVKEGLRSLQVTYPGASGAKWGGYVGGGLNSDTKDLTPYDGISLWVKGDGSSNTIAISLKEADESGVEQETYISGDISLSDTNWHEIEIPFSGFARDPYGVQREGVFSKVIKGYTIIYRGSQVNSLAHYIDYIVAKDVSVSGLPTVTGVTPNSGSNATATDVVISGTNFGGTTSVKIGTWDVSSFSVVSASSINARIPSGLPVGTYHITVTNGYGTSATSAADQFTVTSGGSGTNLPSVTGITPNSGVNTSSTEVTITGTNLGGATSVHIGNVEMPIISISPNTIIAVVPSGLTPGSYHITVTTPNGTSAQTSNDVFVVLAPNGGLVSDTTPPVISDVRFDGKLVLEKDFVSRTPVITALLTDDVAIDPSSIRVQIVDVYTTSTIPTVVFDPTSGKMTLTITSPLPFGEKLFSISVKDTSGNEAEFSIIIKIGNGEDGPIFNYPNPFDPNDETTKIAFNMRDNATVTIYIFDTTGKILAKRVVNATVGFNEIEWNGVDDYGTKVGNGVYIARLVADGRYIGKTKIWVIKR